MRRRRNWERLEAAQRYAACGWPVFPCVPGEKVPVTRHGFLDATTDSGQIARWWERNADRNVGIATGHPGPDVLDVDRHPDRSGFAAFNRLRAAGLVPDAAALVRTPNGGIHAYYRGTEQRNGSLPEHSLDFRARGGYVVASPSTVRSRDGQLRPYEVVLHRPSPATFDWESARRALEPEPQRPPQREQQPDRPASVDHLPQWVAEQPEGNRNAGLFWAANRALEQGRSDALESLARAARAAGLDDREIDRTIRSAQRTTAQGATFRQAEREAGS